jgi:hypothetical protein
MKLKCPGNTIIPFKKESSSFCKNSGNFAKTLKIQYGNDLAGRF